MEMYNYFSLLAKPNPKTTLALVFVTIAEGMKSILSTDFILILMVTNCFYCFTLYTLKYIYFLTLFRKCVVTDFGEKVVINKSKYDLCHQMHLKCS